ncbi:MAG: DUF1538 domain-containing protein [Pseudomonadota bacterium]
MSELADHPIRPKRRRTLRAHLSTRDKLRILWPYVKRNFIAQVQGIWFIVAYLAVFQILVLQLPLVYAGMIAIGIFVVAMGLMFFMEGLRLGLMPLGETIGSVLPGKASMTWILLFAFLLGVGATFAEPAIAVLKAAGSTLAPADAPLLYSLLNEFSGQLVAAVGVGVGVAVLLGVLRFFYAWPLKALAIPGVISLLVLSIVYSRNPILADVLGLAWDCGAVTTGPVTVPLVLALGIGVCRVVSSGSGGGDGAHTGFGIVTLASLFPILAVLLLAGFHYLKADYYGAPNQVAALVEVDDARQIASTDAAEHEPQYQSLSEADVKRYMETNTLPENYRISFQGGDAALVDGKLSLRDAEIVLIKPRPDGVPVIDKTLWDPSRHLLHDLGQAGKEALRAIIPLCVFLFLVLRLIRQKLDDDNDIGIGITFAVVGMAFFGLGIALGLTPLGGQLGGNIPVAFAEIVPWGGTYLHAPMMSANAGKMLAIVFAFFLGYGATLAEPALNALGNTVEEITAGSFKKRLLMQSVAFGVGLGIAAGIAKIAFNISLISILAPAYCAVVILTTLAPNNFVNFSWDSAGVTTGPITVPLVLAMGLGVGGNIPGVTDGFGILALASVGPILSVLCVGLYTQRKQRASEASESADDTTLAVANIPSVEAS